MSLDLVFLFPAQSIFPEPSLPVQTAWVVRVLCARLMQLRDGPRDAFGLRKDFPDSFGLFSICFFKKSILLCGIKDREAWRKV